MEGIWTGLRNFLRPFRGVSKMYLQQYVIIFKWSYNLKTVTDELPRRALRLTVAWYLDNMWWVDRVSSGTYQRQRLGLVA